MEQPNTDRMQSIAKGLPTKSAKIRALTAAGFNRSQIASFLGIRYQHVRNVQIQSEKKAAVTSPEPAYVEVGAGGRIVIPSAFREALGVREGDRLVVKFSDGEVHLTSKQFALRRAQEIVRKHVPAGTSLVDELIADRRREAAQEIADTRNDTKND